MLHQTRIREYTTVTPQNITIKVVKLQKRMLVIIEQPRRKERQTVSQRNNRNQVIIQSNSNHHYITLEDSQELLELIQPRRIDNLSSLLCSPMKITTLKRDQRF